jgi:hypothetical protein
MKTRTRNLITRMALIVPLAVGAHAFAQGTAGSVGAQPGAGTGLTGIGTPQPGMPGPTNPAPGTPGTATSPPTTAPGTSTVAPANRLPTPPNTAGNGATCTCPSAAMPDNVPGAAGNQRPAIGGSCVC